MDGGDCTSKFVREFGIYNDVQSALDSKLPMQKLAAVVTPFHQKSSLIGYWDNIAIVSALMAGMSVSERGLHLIAWHSYNLFYFYNIILDRFQRYIHHQVSYCILIALCICSGISLYLEFRLFSNFVAFLWELYILQLSINCRLTNQW